MSKFVYALVFLYLCYRAVYGAKPNDIGSVQVEYLNYGADGNHLRAGVRKTISCKGSSKNQKVDWYDPKGNLVSRQPSGRVYAQQQFLPASSRAGARSAALVLTFTRTAIEDSGVWECRSGDLKKEVSLCVLDPSEFVNTMTEVTVGRGRSFTLSCESRGEPEPRLLWSRNGEVISDDDNSTKYKVMTKFNSQGFEGLLTIISVEPEDAGIYSCTAVQENPVLDDCSTTKSLNITLVVNYAPTFDSENVKIEHVYGRLNESVNMVCAADGFPVPTYRWFHDLDGDVLTEYPEKDIILSADSSQATLPLVANASTFGEKYMCRATNDFGDAKKYFTVLKLEKPRRPTTISISNSTYNEIEFNVTWTDEVLFPVDGFDIQFFKKQPGTGTPKDSHWKKSKEINLELEQRAISSEETYITLPDLKEETEYWARLRARNEAGESPWSAPILANTIMQPEPETTQQPTTEPTEETTPGEWTEEPKSDGLFYGLFFTGGIIIVAVVSMFVVRMV